VSSSNSGEDQVVSRIRLDPVDLKFEGTVASARDHQAGLLDLRTIPRLLSFSISIEWGVSPAV